MNANRHPCFNIGVDFSLNSACMNRVDANGEASDCNLKLVMPSSSFVHHYKVMLNELLSQMKKDDTDFSASNCLHPSSMRKKYGHTDTKSFRGEDIGVIVLGKFKISSSGRLQLHDKTSSIDVLTPDLLSHRNASRICEVFDYYLIVDGIHESMLHMLFLRKTLRCRSVANPIPLAIENTLPLPLPLPILRI